MKMLLICGMALAVVGFSAAIQQDSAAADQATLDAQRCGACHLQGEGAEGPAVDGPELAASAHAKLACTDCHKQVTAPHRMPVPVVDCAACHEQINSQFQRGVHYQNAAEKHLDEPTCVGCHGDHGIVAFGAPDTPFAKRSAELICSRCHTGEAEQFRASAHAAAFGKPNLAKWAPTCITCHGEHAIPPADASDAPTAKGHIAATCGSCHDNPEFTKETGVPPDRARSYLDSAHGLRSRFGRTSVATCADCHTAHLVLPASDPRSSIAADNVVDTCRKCHADANPNFTSAKVHVIADIDSSPGVFFARWFYIIFIGILVFGFVVHIAFDLFGRRGRRKGGAA